MPFDDQATQLLSQTLSVAVVADCLDRPPSRRALGSKTRQAILDAIGAGANPDALAEPWETPRRQKPLRIPALLCAYACAEPEVARALLSAGSDPNLMAKDLQGRPINAFWASARSRTLPAEEIEFLMRAGADALEPISPHVSFLDGREREPSPCGIQWLSFMGRPRLARLAVELAGSAGALTQLRRHAQELREWEQLGQTVRFDLWGCDMLDMMAAHPILARRGLDDLARLARQPRVSVDQLWGALATFEAQELREQSFAPSVAPKARSSRL